MIGGLFILMVAITVVICCFMCFKECQRTIRRCLMSKEERMSLEQQNKELIEMLNNPTLDAQQRETFIKTIRECITENQKLLRGDGTDVPVADHDEKKEAEV